MTELGDLQREEAFQSVWAGDTHAFVEWLRQPANWAKLDQCLSAHLQPAPPLPNDQKSNLIVAREIETDGRVLVKASLQPTEDKELEHLLDATAAEHASACVWVAPRIEARHRRILEWINSLSGEWFRAFAVEVELWRIKDSPPAPKFTLVCRPPHWMPIGPDTPTRADVRRARQQEFWTQFAQFLEQRQYPYGEVPKPRPQNWMPFSMGRSGFHLSTVFSTPDINEEHVEGELRVELVLRYQEAIARFEALHDRRAELSERIGQPLRWHRRDDMNMARVYVRREISHGEDRNRWADYKEWLYDHLIRFRETFHEAIGEID